jgi:hypothetical protein
MSHKRKGQLTVSGALARHLRPLLRKAFWKRERQAEKAHVMTEGAEASSARPKEGSVEQLRAEIAALSAQQALVELWVPDHLTLGGRAVAADVGMSIILDQLLSAGYFPQGVEYQEGGRLCRYGKE